MWLPYGHDQGLHDVTFCLTTLGGVWQEEGDNSPSRKSSSFVKEDGLARSNLNY